MNVLKQVYIRIADPRQQGGTPRVVSAEGSAEAWNVQCLDPEQLDSPDIPIYIRNEGEVGT